MSSALSSSYSTAKSLAEDFGGRVFVADNKRISVSQRQSVLDAFAKVRGMESAEKVMLEHAEKDMEERFKGKKVMIEAAYSGEEGPALEWRNRIADHFPGYDIMLHKLPISISCHVGAGVK